MYYFMIGLFLKLDSIHLRVAYSILVLITSTGISFAQKKNSSVYPYGGIQDTSRYNQIHGYPLIFSSVNFSEVEFDTLADFSDSRFNGFAYFRDVRFNGSVRFNAAQFINEAYFESAKFNSYADFTIAKFDSLALFMAAHFARIVDFYGVEFRWAANFSNAQFDTEPRFTRTRFDNFTYFEYTRFKDEVKFDKTVFTGLLNLVAAKFERGMDLRQANFDSTTKIYLESIEFPDGRFLFYWDQFSAKSDLRLTVEHDRHESIDEYYRRIEIIILDYEIIF